METEKQKNSYSGIFFVVLSAVFFSLGGLLIKSNTWNPVSINAGRNFYCAIVFAVSMLLTRHKLVINKVVLGGTAATVLMNLLFVVANKLTTAANTIVLQFTAPIFIILLLWVFFKQRPQKAEVITCLFVFGGILCFFLDRLSPGSMLGNLLAILSGFFYAFVFLMKKFKGADFESSIFLSNIVSFLIGLPYILRETDFSMGNNLNLAVMGIVQLAFAFLCLSKGISRVGPVAASLISTIEPILNPILVAAFYGEKIGPMSFAGAVIVIVAAGAYHVYTAGKKEPVIVKS